MNLKRLIIGHLEDRLSQEEEAMFRRWLNEKEANVAYYKKFREGWLLIGLADKALEDKAWERITKECSKPTKKQLKLKQFLWVAAASVTLALGGGITWNYLNQRINMMPTHEGVVLVRGTADRTNVLLPTEQEDSLQVEQHIVATANQLAFGKTQAKKEILSTLSVPRKEQFTLTLSDGSKVYMNAFSKLEFPEHFIGNERRVKLKGEAYFEIKRDTKKPFIVEVNEVDITVLGTSFNVKGYENDLIQTTLVEGSVEVQVSNQRVLLKTGEAVEFDGEQLVKKEIDVDAALAWMKGYFRYQDTPLQDVMNDLARWYDFTYEFETEQLNDIKITAKMYRLNSLEELVDLIKQTQIVDCELVNRKHLRLKAKN